MTSPYPSEMNDNPRLFTICCICFSIVLFVLTIVPEYLPMVDLPQHAAQITMWKQYDAGTLPDMENYRLELFRPYLGGYSVVRLLSAVMPIMLAVKLTVFLSLLMPLAALLLEVRKYPFLRWSVFLVIPFLFNWNFFWGFLNFIFAIGPTLFCLFLTVRWIDSGKRRAYAAICCCALLLFFFHIFAALMYAGLVSAYSVVVARKSKSVVFTFLALLPFIILTMYWRHSSGSAGQAAQAIRPAAETFWCLGFHRITYMPTTMLSGACYGNVTALITLITTVAILAATLYFAKINKHRLFLLLLVFLAYLLLPQYALSCAYLYHRYSFLLIPMAVYAVAGNPPPPKWLARTLQVSSIIIPIIYLSSLFGTFTAFSEEAHRFTKLKKPMEQNRHVLSMMVDKQTQSVAGPVLLHFPAWYQATHGGRVDFNFHSLVKYVPSDPFGRVGNDFLWDPRIFDMDTFEPYDYYIIHIGIELEHFPPFEGTEGKFELMHREGDWYLFTPKKESPAASKPQS